MEFCQSKNVVQKKSYAVYSSQHYFRKPLITDNVFRMESIRYKISPNIFQNHTEDNYQSASRGSRVPPKLPPKSRLLSFFIFNIFSC